MKDPVVQDGAPVLREKARAVLKKDIGTKELSSLINKMRDTLANEPHGVAIAAPQVGSALRVFVVAPKSYKKDEEETETPEEIPAKVYPTVFINPVLKRLSKKKKEMGEGCLSVRGKYGTVMRHEKATIEAWDEKGKPFTYHGSGLIAHIFQHEVDHLDGILYIDKAVTLEDSKETDDEH